MKRVWTGKYHWVPRASLRNLSLTQLAELGWLLVMACIASLTVVFDAPVLLRTTLGIPFVLFTPGYALVSALFPTRHELDGLERVALSFGLSLALIPLIALGIEYSPWRLSVVPITVSLLGASGLFTGIAIMRRSLSSPSEMYEPTIVFPRIPSPRQWDRVTKVAMTILLVSLVMMTGAGAGLVAQRLQGDPMTEFALYNADGEPEFYPRTFVPEESQTIVLEISNAEGEEVVFHVRIMASDHIVEEIDGITLAAGDTWRQPVELTVPVIGEQIPLTFDLFRNDQPSDHDPYRSLRLIVRGEEPTPTSPSPVAQMPTVRAPIPTAVPPMSTPEIPPTSTPEPTPQIERVPARVVEVISGDRLRVQIGPTFHVVHLVGVDAPSEQPIGETPECYAAESLAFSSEMIERAGGAVSLESDPDLPDSQGGELLRYVWLSHPDGVRLLNEELIKSGHAQAWDLSDFLLRERFLDFVEAARHTELGLWSTCFIFDDTLENEPD